MERPTGKETRKIVMMVRIGAALIMTLSMGCGDKKETVLSPSDACDDVACSGHGQCALLADDSPICICDPGYHSNDLDCVQDTPGQECDGVTCSGHGSCLVVQADSPYPVCLCDEGFHVEASTNCVEDQVQNNLSCGPGTHEENGTCIPDDQGRPDDFCVPQLVDDPGRVVIDDNRYVTNPRIAWTGTQFVAIYQAEYPRKLVSRSISMDGTPGPRNDLGSFSWPVSKPPATAGDSVAVLVEDSDHVRSLLILDQSGALVTTVAVPENTNHVMRFKDGFAVLHEGSLLPIATDGTLGDDVVLAEHSGRLGAAAYDADHDQIGFTYTWQQGDFDDRLAFSVASASDFTVLQTDIQFEDLQDQTISFSNSEVVFAAGSYLLKFDAMLHADDEILPTGGDTILHAYQGDGTERSSEHNLGRHVVFMNQLISTGRFAVLLTTRGLPDCEYWIWDATGTLYPPGFASDSYPLDEFTVPEAGGAAYSDKGVAFLTVREVERGNNRLVFSRIECQ